MTDKPANVFRFRDRNGREFYTVARREGDKWTQLEPSGKAVRVADTLRFFYVAPPTRNGQIAAHHVAKRRYGYSKEGAYPIDIPALESYNDSN